MRTRSTDSSVTIEFTVRRDATDDTPASASTESCYICANDFCDDDACGRSLTHLKCCTQTMCCACLAKVVKRCRCADDCDAVIALCPFCREVSPVTSLDVFLGHVAPCKACVAGESKSPSVHEQPEGDA